LPILPYTRRHV
jgi:uncharacterized membrane protein YidH (DUF202 family)